jgi:hypothetical protein
MDLAISSRTPEYSALPTPLGTAENLRGSNAPVRQNPVRKQY